MDASGVGGIALISPLALVAPWVTLGKNVVIHPYAVVGRLPDRSAALVREPQREKQLYIGDNTIIGPHAIIYGGCRIGPNCLIGDHASIREMSDIGQRCVIGRFVSINYDCRIGDDVRFQDTTHITGNCEIGDGCFFGPGVVTSNDRNVDLVDYHFPNPNPPIFGRRVMIGSGANILAGVKVGDDAVIAAGSMVTKSVPANARVMGPAARQL